MHKKVFKLTIHYPCSECGRITKESLDEALEGMLDGTPIKAEVVEIADKPKCMKFEGE